MEPFRPFRNRSETVPRNSPGTVPETVPRNRAPYVVGARYAERLHVGSHERAGTEPTARHGTGHGEAGR